ncbi:5-bromo-4-chloroindolyl phosphate hydrolysis protein [compost metagenome]
MNKILGVIGAIFAGSAAGYGTLTMLGANPITFIIAFVVAATVGFVGYHQIVKLLNSSDLKVAKEETLRLTHEEFTGLEGLSGINVEDFKQLVLGARKKLTAIHEASMRLVDSNLKFKVLSLVSVGNAVIEEVKRDPKDYRIARSWFNTHLDQTLDIINKYNEVGGKVYYTAEGTKLANEFETTVDQLNTNFTKLLEDLRANDMMALKIDMEVLNDQLKLENR